MNPRGKCSKDTAGIWSLFLAVVSISCYGEGKQFTATSMITLFSNLPGQYLKAGTGIRSCSHSCDYGHKNTEMPLCDEAAPVECNTVAQR